jgi:hypothetical protein
MLRNFSFFTAFCLVCFIGVVSASAAAVQWPVSAGGNDHWYEAFYVPNGLSWTDARDAAIAKGGYLACISSAEENSFVYGLVSDPKFWVMNAGGDFEGPFLGGYQDFTKPISGPAEGWTWVSGEPWSYTNWHTGEPNDSIGMPESYLEFFQKSSDWNDVTNTPFAGPVVGYVVESVPEPSTVAMLLSIAVGGLLWFKRRNA